MLFPIVIIYSLKVTSQQMAEGAKHTSNNIEYSGFLGYLLARNLTPLWQDSEEYWFNLNLRYLVLKQVKQQAELWVAHMTCSSDRKRWMAEAVSWKKAAIRRNAMRELEMSQIIEILSAQ